MKRVRRVTIGTAAALPLLLLGSASGALGAERTTSKPCTSQRPSWCPVAGSYRPYRSTGGAPVIYSSATGAGFDVAWTGSTVKPPPQGKAPQTFEVSITYTNRSTAPETFTCAGVSDPRLDKEWLYRGGKVAGYVEASETYCSAHPQATFTLQPQQPINVYARFEYLPWKGDQVSIEWGSLNPDVPPRSPFANPYAQGPTRS